MYYIIKCFDSTNALVSTIDGRIVKNDWLQVSEKLSVLEYAKIAAGFLAEKFDADFITDLALEAEMKYINLTTLHYDGFCLFDSRYSDLKSTNSHAPNNDGWGGTSRPDLVDPSYKYGDDHDLQIYLEFMSNQITELLTNYGPVASIWLDGIGVPLNPKGNNNKEMFKCQDLYDHIHSLQPHVLVSYKQG